MLCPRCSTEPTTGESQLCAACASAAVPSAPGETTAQPEVPLPVYTFTPVGPVGIGGWLILPAIGLVSLPITTAHSVVTDLIPALLPPVWETLTRVGAARYHPLWGPALLFELAANTALIVACVVIGVAFFQKRKVVPRWMIALYVARVVFGAIDLMLVSQIPELADDRSSRTTLAQAGIQALVWGGYFSQSVRVKNTFVH